MKIDRTNKKISIATIVILLIMALLIHPFTNAYASEIPDPEQKGSITVHKHSAISESKLHGTGLEMDSDMEDSLGYPMENVGIRLYKVKSDYTVTHTTTVMEARMNADYVSEKLTSKLGLVEFSNLDHGYYVLVETLTPSGYEKTPDSIVSLPMGITQSGTGWNYNIHVYPKSIRTESLVKEVVGKKAAYSQGESVFWEIQSSITSTLKDGDTYGSFVVTDPLDNRLTYADNSEDIYARGGISGGIKLSQGGDYSVDVDEENSVSWTLTEEGIRKISEEKSTWLSIEFETVINEKAIDATPNVNNIIFNGAIVSSQDAHGTDTEKTISKGNMPSIALSGIKILKTDSIDAKTYLDGAEFKIAKSLGDLEKGIFMKRAGTDEDIVLVTRDNPDTPESETGEGMFTGLISSETENTYYYLVETKAPAGYVLRKSPIEIVIEKDKKIAMATVVNQKIGNPPIDEATPTFPLPKTGGVGTVIIIILGLLMLYASGVLAAYTKKMRDDENASSGDSKNA